MDYRSSSTEISVSRGANDAVIPEARVAIIAVRGCGKSRREMADTFGTTRLDTIIRLRVGLFPPVLHVRLSELVH
ncbi:uncharacterized protein BCR38DRAFT_152079 [Pseudomassariella vexata]|uniref:Uncharacterized protein n=1 Tax=Pseudomassariella vexata TaxID=1141098 RepID=A0A1Y2E6E5_9PEZI|nr:uncharacterized protein BCR38DRAFT_152079 [Pseudomassariella vexata]ORY67143.1 hypothetical protein BCR38DRAFT_152079 [Pseudomassariella vexata]